MASLDLDDAKKAKMEDCVPLPQCSVVEQPPSTVYSTSVRSTLYLGSHPGFDQLKEKIMLICQHIYVSPVKFVRSPFVLVSFGKLGKSRMSLTEKEEERGILIERSLTNDKLLN